MKSDTIITSANVRVALSHQYNTFEVSINIENPNGLQQSEINEARLQAHDLAKTAVEQHKPIVSTKIELAQIDSRLREIKKLAEETKTEVVDPKEVAKVEAMPMYEPKKKITGKSANEFLGRPKIKARAMKIPNDISGLGADD